MYPFRNSGYGRTHGIVPPDYDSELSTNTQSAQMTQNMCAHTVAPLGAVPAYMRDTTTPYHRWLSAPSGGGGHVTSSAPMQAFSTTNRYNALWLFLDLETSSLDCTAPDFGILEIAATVVDDCLRVMDTFHVIVHQPPRIINNASKWCKARFCSRTEGGNDLFAQCESSTITQQAAGDMLEAFILKHAKKRCPATQDSEHEAQKRHLFQAVEFEAIDEIVMANPNGTQDQQSAEPVNPRKRPNRGMEHYRVMLAGCSVYFDRSVLLHQYPRLRNLISHKTMELTSMLEIGRRWRPDLLRSLPPTQECHRALVDVMESVALLRWFWRDVIVGA